jgi:DNA polymerase I
MEDQTFETFIHNGIVPVYQKYTPVNIIAGDTDSVYVDLSKLFDKASTKKDVIEYSDKLGERVNDTFCQFMGDVFNASPIRASVIKTDREAVSDKSAFFSKKRYAMNVINNEGVDCNKLKIMGLEIKKSDTPVIIQKFLKDLVIKLLDNTSHEDVVDFVDNFKAHYMTLGIKEIGKPSNIKTLNKYIDKYNVQGTFHAFPYHVKAAMIYNSLCDSSDVVIRSGDKIKIVDIKDQNVSAIAFPSDSEVLPSFLDHIEIDWKKMWSKVNTKIESYLKPIGYDRKSLQRKIVHEFVSY